MVYCWWVWQLWRNPSRGQGRPHGFGDFWCGSEKKMWICEMLVMMEVNLVNPWRWLIGRPETLVRSCPLWKICWERRVRSWVTEVSTLVWGVRAGGPFRGGARCDLNLFRWRCDWETSSSQRLLHFFWPHKWSVVWCVCLGWRVARSLNRCSNKQNRHRETYLPSVLSFVFWIKFQVGGTL